MSQIDRGPILCVRLMTLLLTVALSNPIVLAASDPIELWSEGPHLRGANIWQRIVVPELDGPRFLGGSHVGPPVTGDDFLRLADLGANLVVLSHPGLYTERPPYRLDEAVQANLDRLVDAAGRAGLFVVIAFRTGPGRSDFTFYRDGAGDWFDPGLLVETVWASMDAQAAWAAMWRHTAARYRNRTWVIGYELMVEPNGAHVIHSIWDPADFYPRFAETSVDWNTFYPRIVRAVRAVDPITPILVGPMGWSSIEWLPFLRPVDAPRIVYTVHQYAPQAYYTHQEPDGKHEYPSRFDLDGDGTADRFDAHWLAERLEAGEAFREEHRVPVAITEFGVKRWVPGAASFLADQMSLFEALGLNYALWAFYPNWPPIVAIDDFDPLHGPDPALHTDTESDLLEVILSAWSRNVQRSAIPTSAESSLSRP